MILNFNKMFFLFILFFSTFLILSSNSWFGCWLGLEINLLSFIPLISNSNNLFSSEASLKYFLIQSIASINFLFLILLKMIFLKNFEFYNFIMLLINSSMLIKMGSIPFHFWFPNIVEGMSWMNCFLLMTWQKISPMIILSYIMYNKFIIIIIIFNSIISSISGLNNISLRKILSFSSMNNLSWMFSSLLISNNLWILYFMLYSMMTGILCFLFYYFNMLYLNQFFFLNIYPTIKISIMINLLSLGGLPPLLGFFPKWMIINYLIMNNFLFMTFIIIIMSTVMLFFYIRIFFSSILLNYIKLKWFNFFFKNNFMQILNMFNFLSLFSIILSTLFFF